MNEEYILRKYHIFYKINSLSVASLFYSDDWYITDYVTDITIKVKDIVYFSDMIKEEEYFQMQLIWDYKFPLKSVYKIINHAYNIRYDYNDEHKIKSLKELDIFKVKNK